MVRSSGGSWRVESGNENLPKRAHEIFPSIKEIVRNHSNSDIYATPKEFAMDPNDTAQKLMNHDPFHEAKGVKETNKENTAYKGSTKSRNQTANTQGTRSRTFTEHNARRRGGIRNALPDAGISREFRIVRDNRINQNKNKEALASLQSLTSVSMRVMPLDSGKSSRPSVTEEKHLGTRYSGGKKPFQALRGPSNTSHGHVKDDGSYGGHRKCLLENIQAKPPSSASQLQGPKSHNCLENSVTLASNSSLLGLDSSSSDPVHVPSGSRSSGGVGAIKREVGVVGIRRNPVENSAKHLSIASSSFSTPESGKNIVPSTGVTKSDPLIQTTVPWSVMNSIPDIRSFSNNQYTGKPHQVLTGNQRAPQANMEWKPKSSKKSSLIEPGSVETAAPPISPLKQNSTNFQFKADKLQNISRVNHIENEHVIIPQHLRVPEADRPQLTFGSFGMECDLTKGFPSRFHGIGSAEQFTGDPSTSARVPSSSNEDASKVDLLDGQVPSSGSDSPASAAVSEHQLLDKKEFSRQGSLGSYADVPFVRNDTPFAPSEPHKEQDPAAFPSFSAYDPQTGYNMPFFRPAMESLMGQGLPSLGEALSSHISNSIPASTVPLLQQSVPQLYPQVHVSDFANFLPCHQFIPQVYFPTMAVSGYPSNPAYPHPSSGSNYLVIQGGTAHLAASDLKYGASQYKISGTPTGFGTYSSQAGYAVSGQGTAGHVNGHEGSTRIKYNGGDHYAQNPEVETSEVWMQTPRELQSLPYFNIAGQASHTAAYLPSHTGYTSFNATPTAHLQFPGLYHPSQPAVISNPHHMNPPMANNVVAAESPQVGRYQQPQVGHLHWNPNF